MPSFKMILMVAVFLAAFSFHMVSAQSTLPKDDVDRVTKQFDSLISKKKVRYMETADPQKNCAKLTEPERHSYHLEKWDGYDLLKCTYSRKGMHDAATKTGTVVMLNASAETLAEWVVSACVELKSKADKKCTDYLRKAINTASSAGQFPVAGLVLEDQRPEYTLPNGKKAYGNGKYEICISRPGLAIGMN